MNDVVKKFLHTLQIEEFDDVELVQQQLYFVLARLIYGLGDGLSYNETLDEILEALPEEFVSNAKIAFDLS
jgi:hypothetical protein